MRGRRLDDSDPSATARAARRAELDLDLVIEDQLMLRTVPGAVDYLFEELRTFAGAEVEVLRRYPDSILVRYRGPLRPLAAVRYFDTCAVALFADPRRRLAESRDHGALAALDTSAELAFRVGDIGADRWELRDQLAATDGWVNRAGSWDVNIEPVTGGTAGEIGGLYLTERFGRLLRSPASTNPVIAAVMVRLAKIEDGQVVLDPFCGAGTLLVVAGEMAKPGRLIGSDAQPSWARVTHENLAARQLPGTVLNADAGHLPFANASIDRVLANMPFGKRVGTHRSNIELYPTALREISRVLTRQGRAVLLTEDKRLFRDIVQRTPLLRVIKEIVLSRGGAHPSAYVVVKRGNTRAFDRSRRG